MEAIPGSEDELARGGKAQSSSERKPALWSKHTSDGKKAYRSNL